jgi:predicted ATP-dependent serine protease
MAGKKFTRKKENFTCEHCGTEVKGTGYTNHCPKCLWSKHVDIHPGDRASKCQGMMKPIEVETKGQEYILTNQCVKCRHEKRNTSAPGDNFEELLKLIKKRKTKKR